MFKFRFIIYFLPSIVSAAVSDGAATDLPSWIAENPAFLQPNEKESVKTGSGSVSAVGSGNLGWLIRSNEKNGHGIEVEVEKLCLNPDRGDYLMVAPWPLTRNFKQIKLFTGTFPKPLKRLRMPNTKAFYIIYKASDSISEMSLTYRRYGISFETAPPDDPLKRKETIFEVQLKGKAPEEYTAPEFLVKFKNAMRAIARRYSISHKIPFDDSIPTQEMILLHKISFCPYEWPERGICASIEHSIFVSGLNIPEEKFIQDYELSQDNLKIMWSEKNFPELNELGVTVFELPRTSSIVTYWLLIIIGFLVVFSLASSFVFWKVNNKQEVSSRKTSDNFEESRRARRPRLKLARQQRIPSFMFANTSRSESERFKESDHDRARKSSQTRLGNELEGTFTASETSQLPIKNYFGSILFSSNRAFEDDEDDGGTAELHQKKT